MPALLSIERHDAVALVTLERPDRRNALSIELRRELADAFKGLAADEGISCLILTGAGSAFCSGMDTTQFGGDRANREALVESSVRAFAAVGRCPSPVIAAVNGPAIAGGFALALLCDVRVASTEATMGFLETGRGIPASYGAASAALAPGLARELCLTGRLVDAQEALRLGVVSEVCDPDALLGRALELAEGTANMPRWALRETKARYLLEGEATWGAVMRAEGEALRRALLERDEPDPAA